MDRKKSNPAAPSNIPPAAPNDRLLVPPSTVSFADVAHQTLLFDQDEVDSSLILIGDAGAPARGSEPVLERLTLEARRVPGRTVVLFLGDNVYPDGLPPESAPSRAEAEDLLRQQARAAINGGASVLFVPGNHDHRIGGVEGVRREERFLARLGDPLVRLLPEDAAPGPVAVPLGCKALLVLLDSQQWIDRVAASPEDDAPTRELAELLHDTGGRHLVVASHHPLVSHGAHGGFFDWRAHLFPLTEWRSYLWVPLPVVGSLLYALPRMWGISEQDLSHAANRRFQERLRWAFAETPPLVYAAGHEHGLQVFRESLGPRASTAQTWLLVSGAGSVSRPDPISSGADTLLASPFPGFMRVDFLKSGRVRCEVIEVRCAPGAAPIVWWLARQRPKPSTSATCA